MFIEKKYGSTLLASSSNDAPQGCKPALGQESGTSFAHRLTAKSATRPFPVAKHCCKRFLLTCRIYVSSLMLLNCACELLPRKPKGAEGSRTPVTGCQASQQLRRNRFSWFCPGPSFFLLRTVSRKTASWQQARSAPKLAKKKQLQLVLPGTLLRAVSIKQTANRRDLETGGTTRSSVWHLTAETGRHRETSRRRSIWHLTGDTGTRRDWETGRQAENRTPESASHFPILYTSS